LLSVDVAETEERIDTLRGNQRHLLRTALSIRMLAVR
jgi:hypothetical protein